jgi:hypothetical protein
MPCMRRARRLRQLLRSPSAIGSSTMWTLMDDRQDVGHLAQVSYCELDSPSHQTPGDSCSSETWCGEKSFHSTGKRQHTGVGSPPESTPRRTDESPIHRWLSLEGPKGSVRFGG